MLISNLSMASYTWESVREMEREDSLRWNKSAKERLSDIMTVFPGYFACDIREERGGGID